MAAPNEHYFVAFPPNPKPYVSHGLPFHKSVAHHAANTFKATRIYIVVSRSVSKTSAFTDLQDALGSKIVGVRYGMAPHTPWEDVFEVVDDLKAKEPDLIVTLGGGSLADGIKLARVFVPNHITTMEGVNALYEKCKISTTKQDVPTDVKPATIPVINVPTTLSGGEFTHAGGATDLKSGHKMVLMHPSMYADLVVFDPALSLSTPERFWMSTGIRGVDHCIEGLYANMPNAKPEVSAELPATLRSLLVNLLKTKKNWGDLDARLQEFLAVKDCPKAVFNGIGASHGIGHQLGPLGVGHGETSCVMLPYVLKYNWQHGGEKVRDQLRPVLDAFWDDPTVVEVLQGANLKKESADPGDLVAAFVSALGQPRSLAHFGIGSDKFDQLAENALKDWCTIVNPVKLDKEKVVEILTMAA
jgi:alcohol dehydrogenase class IV